MMNHQPKKLAATSHHQGCSLCPSAPLPLYPCGGIRRRGFSLIEILVTISIITLLIGISFPVAMRMMGAADTSKARGVLVGLAAAADEYNIATQDVVLKKGDNTNPFGAPPTLAVDFTDSDTNNTLGWFVFKAGALPTVSQLIMNAAKSDLTYKDSVVPDTLSIVTDIQNGGGNVNQIKILDPWDTPIRYAGGTLSNGTTDDKTADDDYLPTHPTAFFASAGPDGLFGVVDDNNQPDPTADANNDGEADAADNIYSFEIDQ